MDKTAIRQWIRQKKLAMTPEEIQEKSRRLQALLMQSSYYRNAKTLYGYLPFNQEVRTVPILKRAMLDGKHVAVPKIFGDQMRFVRISDFERIANGYGGVPEPVDDGPVADDKTALVLMPGLAFDLEGHRVGYGGGFYDKFLAEEPDHPTVALCYDFQVLPHIDTQAHDVLVEHVFWA